MPNFDYLFHTAWDLHIFPVDMPYIVVLLVLLNVCSHFLTFPVIVFFRHYLEQRCSSADELVKRHNMLGKLVAGKIADLMKKKKEPVKI